MTLDRHGSIVATCPDGSAVVKRAYNRLLAAKGPAMSQSLHGNRSDPGCAGLAHNRSTSSDLKVFLVVGSAAAALCVLAGCGLVVLGMVLASFI